MASSPSAIGWVGQDVGFCGCSSIPWADVVATDVSQHLGDAREGATSNTSSGKRKFVRSRGLRR